MDGFKKLRILLTPTFLTFAPVFSCILYQDNLLPAANTDSDVKLMYMCIVTSIIL